MVRSIKAIAIRIVFAASKDRAIVRKAETNVETMLHALSLHTHLAWHRLRGLFDAAGGGCGCRDAQFRCAGAMAMRFSRAAVQSCRVAVWRRTPAVVEVA